jgi:hypothetical protein
MSEEAEQIKQIIEQSRHLRECAHVLMRMHLQLIAEIQNVQEKIEKLKSK